MLAASKVVGRIAKIGGATLGDRFFEYEVDNALEMMRGKLSRVCRDCYCSLEACILQVIARRLDAMLLYCCFTSWPRTLGLSFNHSLPKCSTRYGPR